MKKKILGLLISALMLSSVIPAMADEITPDTASELISVTENDEASVVSDDADREAVREDINITGAVEIGINDNGINGKLADWEAVNVYKLTLNSDGAATLNFKLLESKTSAGFQGYSISVLDSKKNVVANNIIGKLGANENYKFPVLGLSKGTYYVVVELNDKSRWGFASDNYNLKVNYDNSKFWEKELNDTKETANSISVNSDVYGYAWSVKDQDWYRFSLENAGVVKINMGRSIYDKSSYGWSIVLCDEQGNTIQEFGYGNSETAEDATSLEIGLGAGNYYIKVFGTYRYASTDNNAVYRFKLDYTKNDNWEKEANNKLEDSNPIDFGTQYTGLLYNTDDEDWYKIVTDKPMEICITHGSEAIDQFYGWWKVNVYNENKTKLSEDIFRAQTENKYIERKTSKISLGKGTYYIQVSERYRYGLQAKYTIKVEDASVSGFVDRLYTILLGRHAEQQGLDNWTNSLLDGSANAAQIVEGIANSDEFNNFRYSHAEIVERMYEAMLGRASDEAGKQDWVGKLDSGMSVNAIINGFSGSGEFGAICETYGINAGSISLSEARDQNAGVTAFVARCYTKALGRDFDKNGLNDWCGRILGSANQRATALDMASNGFFHSQEFGNKNTSNEEYVDILYRTFLGREADAAGRADWVGKLDAGVSRDDVMGGFSGSVEFDNIMRSYNL